MIYQQRRFSFVLPLVFVLFVGLIGAAGLDAKAVTLFIRKLGVYPPGSLVELSNSMQGMVVSANMRDSMRPSVKVYHPDIPKREALIIDLCIETELTVAKAIKPSDLAPEVLQYLNPGKQVSYYVDAAPRP